MYPFIRLFKEYFVNRNAPALTLTGTHVSRHICWPWDLDLWMELNNGRTLTLYDLGRLPLARRTGLLDVLARQGWSMAMAGCSMRWRRRVRMFDRLDMYTRCVGWDARFIYMEQSMWKSDGDCANHNLVRAVVSDRNGIVSPAKVMQAMGQQEASPPLPDWVRAWAAADAERPWPPIKHAQ